MLWPKRIHTRNLISKKVKIPAARKFPFPHHNFSNGPSLNHRIHYQTRFDNNQSASSQTMRTVRQPVTACSQDLGNPAGRWNTVATALSRRPFSACNKGNRRRLLAGNVNTCFREITL